MNNKKWIRTLTGDSERQVAMKIGMSQPTLNNQLNGTLQPGTVVAIARAYGVNPVGELAKIGLITEAEALEAAGMEAAQVEWALARASNFQIIIEVSKRLESAETGTPIK